MLPIYHLFLVFLITSIEINCFNSCHLQLNCNQTDIHCDNETHLCFCQTNYRVLRSNVCLQSANVNTRCMIYQPCVNAKCITTKGIEVNFNDIHRKNSFWKSSLESVFKKEHKILAFCRCDKPSAENCNYRVIGNECSDHRECSQFVANSECRNGICSCNQTHYHLDDTCLQKKNFDQICSENSECIANLYCRSSQCKCRKNYEFNENGICSYKSSTDTNEITSNISGNLWDGIAKVGGFIIIVVLMLFLCTKKDSELQNTSHNGSTHRRRSVSSRHHHRSASINSHRPLTQTSSNASRSSAYRTFEEPALIRQTIIIPSPAQLARNLSSSSDEVDYNPYQFDTLFPQQSDNDDPPSYEEVVQGIAKH